MRCFAVELKPLLGESILFESTWLIYHYIFILLFFCDHVDSGIEKPLACYSILFSFGTYLFVSYLYWHMFFTFSAIKIPKKDFSSDLPIGASPRRHKELLVHEEEDSRHLEHSWEPSPPKKNQSRCVYCNRGESSRFPRFSVEAMNYMELWLVEVRRGTRYTDITFWRHGVLNQISFCSMFLWC